MRKEKSFVKKPRGAGVLSAVGLPPDACGRLPLITLTGNKYACIERHNGVLKLSPDCVRLYSPCGIIRFEGKELTVTEMDNEQILLQGFICGVIFE